MPRSINRRRFIQGLGATGLGALAVGFGLNQPGQVYARVSIKTRARTSGKHLDAVAVHELPFPASHVAIYWEGEHEAIVTAAFSKDGMVFGPPAIVKHDEIGAQTQDGRTYGAVRRAGAAIAVRVTSDRSLERLNVLGMADGTRTVSYQTLGSAEAAALMPPVIARAGWGCDESLMTWTPQFYPCQKLICHHTATQNNDPDPMATIRSIYYYHAVTQGWGDIGYNFLVDETGRMYEGRYSRSYAANEYPSGEDLLGNGVTAAHAYQFNSGTVGIALLGTLTSQDATAPGRHGLEQMLAWKADRHTIDPNGAATYTNPVTGTRTTFPDIAGHSDVIATECPGSAFYPTLPTIRNEVAAIIGSSGTTTTPSPTATPTTTLTSTPSETPTKTSTPTPTRTPTRTPTATPTRRRPTATPTPRKPKATPTSGSGHSGNQ